MSYSKGLIVLLCFILPAVARAESVVPLMDVGPTTVQVMKDLLILPNHSFVYFQKGLQISQEDIRYSMSYCILGLKTPAAHARRLVGGKRQIKLSGKANVAGGLVVLHVATGDKSLATISCSDPVVSGAKTSTQNFSDAFGDYLSMPMPSSQPPEEANFVKPASKDNPLEYRKQAI
jgi:hypothetical protein